MILLANGCSWTWGGSLEPYFTTEEERLSLCWPHHLGKLLNCEESHNLAAGGGSNDRILRTTYDWLSRTDMSKIKKTVAVIQWTEPMRFEFYVPQSNIRYENIEERWAKAKLDCIESPEDLSEEAKLKRTNQTLSTWTEIQGLYKMIFQLEALSSLFNRYNVKYFYWSWTNSYEAAPEYLRTKLIDHPWIDLDQSWKYDRVSSWDTHPSLQGNKDLGNIIYNIIKDKI